MNTKIIAALGNPGTKYEKTRHNAGVIALEVIVKELEKLDFSLENTPWSMEKGGTYDYVVLRKGDVKIVCIRPQTYMNLSGKALIRAKNDFYVKDNENILIVSDELDMPVGALKLAQNKYSKTHHGIESVVGTIGKNEYFLRLGVDSRKNKEIPGEEYVLTQFTDSEIFTLKLQTKEIFPRILKEFI